MDNGKFWSHIYHQKELVELIFSFLSGTPTPCQVFFATMIKGKAKSSNIDQSVIREVQKITVALINTFTRVLNFHSDGSQISQDFYETIIQRKQILRAEVIFHLLELAEFEGPKQHPKLSRLIWIIYAKNRKLRREIEGALQFLIKQMQAIQRNLIRCSTGTDSILDKAGEARQRSELIEKFIEHGWILKSILEIFPIESIDILQEEGCTYILFNALLLVTNKLAKWEQLYDDGLMTQALSNYLASLYGDLMERFLGNALVNRQDFAEKDFANIRIFSAKSLCSFVERVSRFQNVPRSILTKDANLVEKYETGAFINKLVKKFNLKKIILSLGPQCIEPERKSILQSILASLAGEISSQPKRQEEEQKMQQEMDPMVLELAGQFYKVDIEVIQKIVKQNGRNKVKIRDILTLQSFKPLAKKKEEKSEEQMFKTYHELVAKKYILPNVGQKKKKGRRNLAQDFQNDEADDQMKAKVLELTYQGSHRMYEDDFDEFKQNQKVIAKKKQKVQESQSEDDKFELQQEGGSFEPSADQIKQARDMQKYLHEQFPEDKANSMYYENQGQAYKPSENEIKSYGNQWVLDGSFPMPLDQEYGGSGRGRGYGGGGYYQNEAKDANHKKWALHNQKHHFHHNKRPPPAGRGRGTGRGGGWKKRGGQKGAQEQDGYAYNEGRKTYVKKS